MWFRKKTPKPTFMQRLMNFKGMLGSMAAIVASLTYFYGFVAPNFEYFHGSAIKAVVVGQANQTRSLFVQIESDRIPNVPVTISFTVDGVDIAHRHYSLGIPSIKGIHYEEGKATWIEPIPLLFTIQNPKLTVRFSFQGVKTLMVPYVVTFKTDLLDGNPKKKTEDKKPLLKGVYNV